MTPEQEIEAAEKAIDEFHNEHLKKRWEHFETRIANLESDFIEKSLPTRLKYETRTKWYQRRRPANYLISSDKRTPVTPEEADVCIQEINKALGVVVKEWETEKKLPEKSAKLLYFAVISTRHFLQKYIDRAVFDSRYRRLK